MPTPKKSISERELGGAAVVGVRLPAVVKPRKSGLPSTPPSGMGPAAVGMYRNIRNTAWWLLEEDVQYVMSLCLKFQRADNVRKGLREWEKRRGGDPLSAGGMMLEGDYGWRINPLLPELNKLETAIDKQLEAIGLTPRARIQLNLSDSTGDDSTVDMFREED